MALPHHLPGGERSAPSTPGYLQGSAQSPEPPALCPSLRGPAREAPGAILAGGGWRVRRRGGSCSAVLSAGSRTGTETGRTPREGNPPHTPVRRPGTSTAPPLKSAHGFPGEHEALLLPLLPLNSPIWVTYQVTKFYGGHRRLEDGPETPKEMGCQSISKEGRRNRGVQSTLGITWIPSLRLVKPQSSNFSPTALTPTLS